jgi:cytochrome d ubiquinol oxidase subunit I
MQRQKTLGVVGIPHLGSLVLTHSWDGQIKGLSEFPAGDRPNSTIVFWTFRLMVGLGLLMLLLGVGGALLRWRGQLYQNRLFLRFAVAMGPAGIVALLAGWMTTEIGRQPWVVYGVMRTADGVAHHSALALSATLLMFVVVYCAVFGTGISYLLKLIASGPDRGTGTPADTGRPQQRPSRPLSAAPNIDPSPANAGE